MNAVVVLTGAVAFLISLLLPVVLRSVPAAPWSMDVPNFRSSHSEPVLRVGGIAPFLGIAAGAALALAGREGLASIGLAFGLVIGIVGFIDDVRTLPALPRLGVQIVTGALVGLVLATWFDTTIWLVVPVALAFTTYVNVVNFMDGIDGISGFHGGLVGITYLLIGIGVGQTWLQVSGAVIAGAYLAFVPWNLLGRRMFLGDVGSYLLGGTIAVVATAMVLSGVPWPAVLGPLAIYGADTTITLVRRVLRGEPWWRSHREHLYQKLVDKGHSHIQVSAAVTVLSAITALGGAMSMLFADHGYWMAVFIIGVTVTVYALGAEHLSQRSLRYSA